MIPVVAKVTKLNEESIPFVQNILDQIIRESTGIRYADNATSAARVAFGEVVIMDDGAGVKRIYVRTGKDNVGYITLT